MLSKNRRRGRNRLTVARELDGTIHDWDFPQDLMIRLDHHFPRNGLRLRKRVLDPQYGRMRNLVSREELHEVRHGLLAGEFGDPLIH